MHQGTQELCPDGIAFEQGRGKYRAPGQTLLFPKPSHSPRPAPKKFSLNRRRTKEDVEFKLTPSAIWLLQYILEPALKKSRGAWTHINITDLSKRPLAPSRRALQEALNRIEGAGEAVGIALRCTFDRGIPRLLFASTDWLRYDREPLFFKRDRITSRHLRPRCHCEDIALPRQALLSMLEASGVHVPSSSLLPSSAICRGTSGAPPHCADSAPLTSSHIQYEQQYTPAGRLVRLRRKAWSVTRKIMQTPEAQNTNCKVSWNGRTAWSYAFKALRQGHDQWRIVSCYAKALQDRHELATFVREIWSPASTVTLARRFLEADGFTETVRRARMNAKLEAQHRLAMAESNKAAEWFRAREP